MSYDLAVWEGARPLTDAALHTFRRLYGEVMNTGPPVPPTAVVGPADAGAACDV
jgi:hypothetical protein